MKTITKGEPNEMIDVFIDNHKEFITGLFDENKGLPPIFSILTEKDDKISINVFPVMQDMEDKDFIRYKLLEAFKKMLREQGHKIHCVSFASEAWMYQATKEEQPDVEKKIKNGEWKKLPKKEVLILSFDGKEVHKQVVYNIKRKMSVGDEGLGEAVTLEYDKIMDMDLDKTEGRFTNLFD